MKELNEKIKALVGHLTYKNFDTDGGITIGGTEGELFDLSGPKEVIELKNEYVKRLKFSNELAQEFIENQTKLQNFLFEAQESFKKETNVKYYTFKSPDGDNFVFEREDNFLEVRIYGLK